MGPIPLELSLDCRSTWTIPSEEYVPRTIGAFISQVSMIGNVSERMLKLDNYVKRLEDEMRKIDVFKRELPLCMLLLSDAITIVKLELVKYKKENSEPVLEEFIPIDKDCEEEDGESEEIKMRKDMDSKDNKMNWMSSVQLWNHDHYSPELDSNPKEIPKSNAKKRTLEDKNGAITDNFLKSCSNAERAFVPFNKVDVELPSTKLLSLNSTGIKRTREDLSCSGMDSKIISNTVSSSMPKFQSGVGTVSQVENPTSRKQRRCWSPELHLRFVEALHQLGGCQVATPKQIRELMQVDGLTNDEVKSHLQKYRLHTQRLPATSNTHRDESHALLRGSRMSNRALGESTKQSNILSDSPQSPPQLCGGTSMTSGDSMEDEDDDEKSESHSWKSHVFDK